MIGPFSGREKTLFYIELSISKSRQIILLSIKRKVCQRVAKATIQHISDC